jgi:nitrogen regulatory protein PII
MKMVWAVVRSSKADSIAERLKSIGVGGCTVTRVRGYGGEWHVYEPLIHGGHHKLEAIVEDDKAEAVVTEIAEHGYTGLLGDGIVSVFDLGSVVDIRSKQHVKSSDDERTGGSKDAHGGATFPGAGKNRES